MNSVKLFLDTEFNSFRGSLIALALVSENDNDPYFYKVYDLPEGEQYHPWVEQNVVPYLDKYEQSFYTKVDDYLTYICDSNNVSNVEIVADWPEDIMHLCSVLMPSPGYMVDLYNCKVVFELETEYCSGPYQPIYPHNALSDAMANRMNYMNHYSSDEEE